MNTQFIVNKDFRDDERLSELLNTTIERLPQYKWLLQNEEKHNNNNELM
ncbi:MAG: hypothetical protein KBE27_04770 [Syntrophorhabdaceae bacterium]|nr:hypothetical protein [Syntrophorhabdales bacterium]MBP9561112.1 hypothetical protein [Syntrophorhabdaceae bacterium]